MVDYGVDEGPVADEEVEIEIEPDVEARAEVGDEPVVYEEVKAHADAKPEAEVMVDLDQKPASEEELEVEVEP